MSRFNEGNTNTVLLMAPQDVGAAGVKSNFLNAGLVRWLTFDVAFGNVNGDDAVVSVEVCTANATSGASLAAIPFRYRLSGALGADTWGAVTTASSSGATLTSTSQSNTLMKLDVDPGSIASDASAGETYKYIRVVVDPGSSISACLASVVAQYEPRYSQLDPVTSS